MTSTTVFRNFNLTLFCALALITAVLGEAQSAYAVSPPNFKGFFAVLDISGSSPINTTVFSQPVDGIFIRSDWGHLEPQPNVYDFSRIDQAARLSIQNGKKIILGVSAGDQSPPWLFSPPYSVNSSFFIWSPHGGAFPCQNITIPWPWDPIFQQAFRNMVRNLAAHLKATPGVFSDIVSIKLSGINIDNVQFQLPASNGTPGLLCTPSDAVATWQQAGYTPDKIIATWTLFAAAIAEAFPNQVLSESILAGGDFPPISNSGQIVNGPGAPGYVDIKQTIVTSALQSIPGRFAVDTTALTAYAQPQVEQAYGAQGAIMGYQANDYLGVQGGSGCGASSWFEPAYPCTSAGYESILMNGVGLNAAWVEVQPPNVSEYPSDVVRADAALDKRHP